MFSRLSKTYAKLKSYVPRKVGFLKNKWEVGVTVPKKNPKNELKSVVL